MGNFRDADHTCIAYPIGCLPRLTRSESSSGETVETMCVRKQISVFKLVGVRLEATSLLCQ